MDELIARQAELLKALAHPIRLRLISALAEDEHCVCELMADNDLEQATVSQHLAVLRNQGIVETRREGTRIIYRLKRPEVRRIVSLAAVAVAAQLREDSSILLALGPERDHRGGED